MEAGTATDHNNQLVTPSSECDNHDVPVNDSHGQTEAQCQQAGAIGGGSPTLRRGKWAPEEEAFAHAAIRDFNSGYLDAQPGTTLRTYLSQALDCDPMRITKKFTGDASIGKKVFHPAARDDPKILKDITDAQARLSTLYHQWKERLESQEQEMARKSMAAAAVSVATLLSDNLNLSFLTNTSPSDLLRGVGSRRQSRRAESAIIESADSRNDVAKAATWLTWAEYLLSKNIENNHIQKDIEDEMKAIAVLIEEAPEILAISKNLPQRLGCKDHVDPSPGLQVYQKLHSCPELRTMSTSSAEVIHSKETAHPPTAAGGKKRSMSSCDDAMDSPTNPMKILASLSSQAAPLTINNIQAVVEDASAFVNFLQSVVDVKNN